MVLIVTPLPRSQWYRNGNGPKVPLAPSHGAIRLVRHMQRVRVPVLPPIQRETFALGVRTRSALG